MNNLENLEQKLLNSPVARARFLADTLELLERNGVDINAVFQDASSFDLTDGQRFLGGLAASSLVITRSSTGKGIGSGIGSGIAADTVVITRTSTGKGLGSGAAANTLVITRTSTGKGLGPGAAANTVVITRSSTGRLTDLATQLRSLADSVQRESTALTEQEEEAMRITENLDEA